MIYLMEESSLINEMISQNPWWKSGKMELNKRLVTRELFGQIADEVDSREISCIIGLRQIGKTTLLKQLISRLLMSGKQAKNILYFSFDGLREEENIAERVLEAYSTQIVKRPLSEKGARLYIFLDEVQKARDWSEKLKSIHDKNYNVKFLVSGSSGMNILKGSGESLIGRINIHKMAPFSFAEFLSYQGVTATLQPLSKIAYPIEAEKISILFEEYLKVGGLPGLYELNEPQFRASLKTIVDLNFYRDILNLFEVKRADVLEGLFYSFIAESGTIINYNRLSSSLKTKFETVKTYTSYLESSFLISKSGFFSKSMAKSLEKNPKIYISDNSFFSLVNAKPGLVAETCVFNHIKDKKSYWQDEKKQEVDIICENKRLLPIEVKYQNSVNSSDIAPLLKFMDENKLKKGVIITKKTFKTEKIDKNEILFVPAWLFLLTSRLD
jgi:predicted AAA+ superfamily ATPase